MLDTIPGKKEMRGRMERVDRGYEIAREMYAEIGVNTDLAMEKLDGIPVSMHCWQIDDLSGFENPDKGLTGGIQATGRDPSKAKNKDEFYENLEKALSLVPGRKKVALHPSSHFNHHSAAHRRPAN